MVSYKEYRANQEKERTQKYLKNSQPDHQPKLSNTIRFFGLISEEKD
jgi:hypothetical protein